jgi:hypothetical protein
MNDSIYPKSKPLHLVNIWNDDIGNEINNSHHIIFITNIINIEHYDLQFDFVIQSHTISNQKSKTLEDENFIISSYFMMMKEFEYCILLKQLNEEQRLIFDDIMHRKQLYHDISICLFLTRGVGT